MTEKRKSKRPKAMRVTTEASKAKLPAPTRKRKATPRETWAEGYAKWEAKAERAKRVQCPRCEKLVPGPPNDIHTCYDAKALREARAIPCGGDVTTTTGTATPDVFRVMFPEPSEPWYEPAIRKEPNARIIVQFVTRSKTPLTPEFQAELRQRFQSFLDVERDRIKAYEESAEIPPPDTSAYPWGLKFAWWLDGVPTRVRRWLAVRLRWLAGKVAP